MMTHAGWVQNGRCMWGGEYILMGLESIGSMGEKNRRKRTYAKNEITLKKLEIYSKINDNPK